MENRKTKRIFTLQLAKQLEERGNIVIKTERNRKNAALTVFTFELTEKFEKDLAELTT